MRIAIVGFGFVGKALFNGIKEDVETFKVDPLLNTKIKDLDKFEPEIIFICIPTPMNSDGSQDISNLKEVIDDLRKFSSNSLIVLKSTILPSYVKEIKNALPNIVYNPEFLRERFANEDFINSKLIILGGEDKSTKIVGKFYSEYTKCKNHDYQYLDLQTASLIKYAINTFLSIKVVYFNELYNIFNNLESNSSWQNFIDIISIDQRIGNTHMNVPGPDGRLGFGGPCFPKDCNALIKYSYEMGHPFKLLEEAVNINNNIRSQYDQLTKREADQNINFDITNT